MEIIRNSIKMILQSNRIKYILILVLIIFSVQLIYADSMYLLNTDGEDISNNNTIAYENSKIFSLRFTSDMDSAYYVIWPDGKDTVKIYNSKNNIFSININPNMFSIGNYFIEILNNNYQKELNFSFDIKKNISFFNMILFVLLGLIFFMLGLKFTSKGLSRISGYRLKEILWNLSESPIKGILSGLILTLMLQSSTVFSVMITSFVSDGLIGITGAISMIAGSAIGTSIIVQIIAFNISFFSILMIIIGFYFYDRIKQLRQIGLVIMGFGFIFYAIQLMANSIMPIKDTVLFQNMILFLQSNLLLLFILTTLFTFSVHSSAVIIALIMGFSAIGLIPFNGAIIMIAGANIGTTFTAMLASLRGSQKAKYINFVNFFVKLITAIIFIIIAIKYVPILSNRFNNARGIANLHLIFNIVFAIVIIGLLPVIKYFGKFFKKKKVSIIDKRILNESIKETPLFAVGHIMREILKMADIAYGMLEKSFYVFKKNDKTLLHTIIKEDDKIDEYEKEITLFLIALSGEELPTDVSTKIKSMFFLVDEIEHIGDIISKNLMVNALKKIENNYYFSDEGFQDIKKMYEKVLETYRMVLSVFVDTGDIEVSKIMSRREDVLNFLQELHVKHLKRLQSAVKESIETSTLHLDILNDYERINFHSYKMSVYINEKNSIE